MVGTKVEFLKTCAFCQTDYHHGRRMQHLYSIQQFPHSVSQVVVSIQNETKFSPYNDNQLTKNQE